MLILVAIVWVLSCCTSFAFNKNDFKREFGYLTQGRNAGDASGGHGTDEEEKDEQLISSAKDTREELRMN